MSFRWGLLRERRPRIGTVDCVFHEVQRDDSMGGAIYCFDARGEWQSTCLLASIDMIACSTCSVVKNAMTTACRHSCIERHRRIYIA